MSEGSRPPTADEIGIFITSLLGNVKSRRSILNKWHQHHHVDAKTLPAHMAKFIDVVLFDPFELRVFKDHLCCFGSQQFPIEYSWLDADQKAFVIHLCAFRKQVFAQVRDQMDGDFVLHQLQGPYVRPDYLSHVARRQIVRDFSLMVWSLPDTPYGAKQNLGHLRPALIVAVQTVLLQRQDTFLSALHQCVQRKPERMGELPCWNLVPSDLHPEEKEAKEGN